VTTTTTMKMKMTPQLFSMTYDDKNDIDDYDDCEKKDDKHRSYCCKEVSSKTKTRC